MAETLLMRARAALSGVLLPQESKDRGKDIVTTGRVRGLATDQNGTVKFTLELEPAEKRAANHLLEKAKTALGKVGGVTKVSAVATAHHAGDSNPPSLQTKKSVGSGHDNPLGVPKKPRIEEAASALANVKAVIAVASGKGGVGKSTVAANLAIAFAQKGFRTGLMDADIYGPSLPVLFGLSERAHMSDGKIMPFEKFGVRSMSIGSMVDDGSALAWRGPMVMGAVRQLISDVDWGPLDILLIDTPPGTGDAHISLIQSKLLTGAVIVSTPQEMALADVRRGVSLFNKTSTPIIGVIENMAWLELGHDPIADDKPNRQYLFGEGGARRAANELGVPFLGELPIFADLRVNSDAGTPIMDPTHPAYQYFSAFADEIAKSIP